MLPDAVAETARRAVRMALNERHEVLARDVADIRERFSSRGVLYSSMFFVAVKDRIASEFSIRATVAWQNWARALATQPTVPLANLRSTLIAAIEGCLRVDGADSSDLAQHYVEAKNLGNVASEPADTLARMAQRAVDKITIEIDFAILEATKSQPADSQSATFNIYAPIGVIQTGAGSTASVQQHFGPTERDTIRRALEAVEQSLPTVGQMVAVEREQLSEVVAEVRQELDKAQPNALRVRSAMTGIASTIQTLGAAAPAYALVKGALALLGVHLP